MSSTPCSLQPREAAEEWRELESDPGLFSLLVEEFGVRGVKVEEVYDISKNIETKVYGFVFLFRYELGDRRARKKARDLASEDVCYVLEPSIINDMFFAHQIIVNSCATHALLSVLLNCPELELGPTLTKLKNFSTGLDPESKGFAIANMMELSRVHNKHARPSNVTFQLTGRKGSVVSSAHALLPETYHFVSYVPVNGRLFELDGLKEYPIDHGPWGEHEEWTDLFQRTISFRLSESENFLFNLMALIPDPALHLNDRLKSLCHTQEELLHDTIRLASERVNQDQRAMNSKDPDCSESIVPIEKISCYDENKKLVIDKVTNLLPPDIVQLSDTLQHNDSMDDDKLKLIVAKVLINAKEIENTKQKLKEHLETMQRYQIEHSRRIHDYEPFVTEFIRMLAQNNQLPPRVMKTTVKSVSVNNTSHKRKKIVTDKKPKTTLLVNGTQVN